MKKSDTLIFDTDAAAVRRRLANAFNITESVISSWTRKTTVEQFYFAHTDAINWSAGNLVPSKVIGLLHTEAPMDSGCV